MFGISRQELTKRLQRLFWIYLTDNFILEGAAEATLREQSELRLAKITPENCSLAGNFRTPDRIGEYRKKLERKEVGYYAIAAGDAVGSIWATINRTKSRRVARTYMPLMAQEAMIHDIVTGERFRGKGVGPFMVAAFAPVLFKEYGVKRVIVDVNVRNKPSLRMMEKAGLHAQQRVLYVSALGTLLAHKTLK